MSCYDIVRLPRNALTFCTYQKLHCVDTQSGTPTFSLYLQRQEIKPDNTTIWQLAMNRVIVFRIGLIGIWKNKATILLSSKLYIKFRGKREVK